MTKDDKQPVIADEMDALDRVPSGDVLDIESGHISDPVVEIGGRAFTIEEPSLDITLRVLNALGRMALRGEKAAEALLRNPSSRAALWGLLAVVDARDLEKLGSALLQFEDDREGRDFIRGLQVTGQLRVAPLIKAFFLNWSLSTDLQEALANFTVGVVELQTALSVALPTTPAAPESE